MDSGSQAAVSSENPRRIGMYSSIARLSLTTTTSGRSAARRKSTSSRAFAVGKSPETRILPVPSFRWEATRPKPGSNSTSAKSSRTKGSSMPNRFYQEPGCAMAGRVPLATRAGEWNPCHQRVRKTYLQWTFKTRMPKRSTEDKRLCRLSEIAFALPETQRQVYGSHAQFLVRKKTFAYFLDNHHGDGIVAVTGKVLPGDNKALAAAQPARFYLPSYVASRGWVALRLDTGTIDWDEVKELLFGSYMLIA